jgi:CHAT domain-containing protein
LNLVPFAALVDEHDQYLVERYSISYLTSGRDLLRLRETAASRQPPVVIADPQFGAARPATPSAENARRSADMGRMQFSRLAGTAQEAAALGAELNGVRVLTREQATEAALKSIGGPRVLHVATHGFFLPDQLHDFLEGGRGGADAASASRAENPLLRSGVALAGANERSSAGGEDGILTALEAAGLDLWGTKLVVLSACETGLGEVKNGEGVYGLRRALVLAGSESQVMSLWQVADEATRDLMTAYYARLQAGEGRAEALRAVQLEMLRGGAREGDGAQASRGLGGQAAEKPADRGHPFYWAAFIQSGEWKSLEGK